MTSWAQGYIHLGSHPRTHQKLALRARKCSTRARIRTMQKPQLGSVSAPHTHTHNERAGRLTQMSQALRRATRRNFDSAYALADDVRANWFS
jgi:hypothetical protein